VCSGEGAYKKPPEAPADGTDLKNKHHEQSKRKGTTTADSKQTANHHSDKNYLKKPVKIRNHENRRSKNNRLK